MNQKFDIFISYKRKSLNTAYLLYTKLSQRGYSVFLDIEELGPGEFDEQIYRYIDGVSDVVVLIEEGSLDRWTVEQDGSPTKECLEDWFYKEVAYSYSRGKNIIPIWHDCQIVDRILPKDVATITKLQSKPFILHYINAYIEELEDKNFIKSLPYKDVESCSVFKLYSNRNCEVYNGKELVGKILSYAEEPLYWYVSRKGEYRLKCVSDEGSVIVLNNTIAENEEKIIDIKYKNKKNDFKYLYVFILSIILVVNVTFLFFLWETKTENPFNEVKTINEVIPMIKLGTEIETLKNIPRIPDNTSTEFGGQLN